MPLCGTYIKTKGLLNGSDNQLKDVTKTLVPSKVLLTWYFIKLNYIMAGEIVHLGFKQ